MSSPSSLAFQELDGLDRSSPGFSHKLVDILRTRNYAQSLSSLEGDDLKWLVDYLDEASRDLAHPRSSFKQV